MKMNPVQAIDRPTALDFFDVWEQSHRLADALRASPEVDRYVASRAQLDIDASAVRWQRALQDARLLYEEAQRFGHFHPNYHEAHARFEDVVRQGDRIRVVRDWKDAEHTLSVLLYEVGRTIAHAISPSIKVPTDVVQADASCGTGGCSTGGCGSGGSCGCG